MKQTLVLSAMLFLFLASYSQKPTQSKWFIRPNWNIAASNGYDYDKMQQLGFTQGKLKTSNYGIDVGRNFKDFYVSIGLGYQQLGYNIEANEFLGSEAPYFKLWAIEEHKEQFITMPVSIGTNIKYFFIQANIIPAYYLTGYSRVVMSVDPAIPIWNENPDYDPDFINDIATRFNVLAGITTGAKIPITKKIAIQLAADTKVTLLNTDKLEPAFGEKVMHRFFTLGGTVGLVFNLK